MAINIIDKSIGTIKKTSSDELFHFIESEPRQYDYKETEGHLKEKKLLTNQVHITGSSLHLITLRGSSAKES